MTIRRQEFKSVMEMLHKTMYIQEVRDRFIADPRGMLLAAGLELGPDDKIFVHENKPGEYHFTVPAFITKRDFLDDDQPHFLLP